VRAILSGTQTQDRRPVKPPPPDGHTIHTCWNQSWKKEKGRVHASWEYWTGPVFDARPEGNLCGLYGAVATWSPGDVLYVRETWRPYIRGWSSHVEYQAGSQHTDRPVTGKSLDSDASDAAMEWQATRGGINEIECRNPDEVRWFPSIHMPKWASRLRLCVLSVRCERVNAISEADARAEGVADVAAFGALWDSLYGAGSFDAATWCWVTEFEVDCG
jgi:hypothetical protein